ncbi:hypothetical protein G6L37_07135 [Agrobacterium rubi]|nr:hypothetical protein [Agrobacterium rubi]NTF25140.1 hypothetical protein [Agrobacterium rubi]
MTALDLDRDVAATPDNKAVPSGLSFEFNRDGSGNNTRFEYEIVDRMAGKTAKSSVVLEGRITLDDVQDLAENLECGCFLDVHKAGFPDLAEKMPSSWVDTGESMHILRRISFSSNPAPGYLPTTDQFLASVIDYQYD